MADPVYVLLPESVEWTAVPGTDAQRPGPVRWYLRQHMLDAATQTAVLVSGDDEQRASRAQQVAARARDLGGMAIDASTQQPIEPSAHAVG